MGSVSAESHKASDGLHCSTPTFFSEPSQGEVNAQSFERRPFLLR